MNQPPTLHLDLSTARAGLHLVQNGREVSLEMAFAQGMVITPEDMPCLATLLTRFVATREEHAQ